MCRCAVVCALPFLLASVTTLGAETLRFRYAVGDRYRIKGTVNEEVYLNGRLDHRAEILNKIAAEVTQVRDGAGLVVATFQTSERRLGSSGLYSLNQDYLSEFWRDERGGYDIDAGYFMPVVRNVPHFLEGEVVPGDTWTAPGSEAHDFRASGIPEPLTFPITVAYHYKGDEQADNRSVAIVDAEYTVFQRLRDVRALADFDPVLLTGYSDQTLRFDVAAGQLSSYEEEFTFIFTLQGGSTVEYRGRATGELTWIPAMDREEVARGIREALDRASVPDTHVGVDERGVTIVVENIQFPPDSDALLPAERRKIERIAEILRPIERDILIVGHTARVGSEETSQTLSEARARAVGDHLLSLGAKSAEQMVTKGVGSREPIADNATEAGRSRNRRVEITILEN
jgi:outer membrane protein OmpA-like peptidoglycan-associated protein